MKWKRSGIGWPVGLVGLVGQLASWPVGRLASWSFGQLAGWPVGQLASWPGWPVGLVGQLAWLVSWPVGWLGSWPVGQLASRLVGELAGWPFQLAIWPVGRFASWPEITLVFSVSARNQAKTQWGRGGSKSGASKSTAGAENGLRGYALPWLKACLLNHPPTLSVGGILKFPGVDNLSGPK